MFLAHQIFNHARMAPSQQLVQIPKLFVKLVILRRTDQNDFE